MFYRHYHLQRSEYYYQKLFPSDYGIFKQWLNPDSYRGDEKPFKSTADISYRNIPFGKNKDFIINHIGKPRYELHKTGGFTDFNVLFYKTIIHGIKLIMQFHLINDMFFFGCHTFSNVEHTKFNAVTSLLVKKYCPGHTTANNNGQEKSSENPYCLADGAGNKIFIVGDVILRLCYLTGNKRMKELLAEAQGMFSMQRTSERVDPFQTLAGIL